MDGDTLAVTGNAGTPTAPTYRTYVFTYGTNGWTQTQVLDGGGSAVALDNDTLVIGDGITLGPIANRVRIYRQTAGTFQELATLNGDPTFGHQLALRDDLSVSSGAYVLDLAAGPPSVSSMVHLDTGASQSIAVTRDRIAVGSSGRGAVDVFDHGDKGWALAAHITAPPALGNEYPLFGMTVALDGSASWSARGARARRSVRMHRSRAPCTCTTLPVRYWSGAWVRPRSRSSARRSRSVTASTRSAGSRASTPAEHETRGRSAHEARTDSSRLAPRGKTGGARSFLHNVPRECQARGE